MRAVAAVGRGGRPGPPALRLLLALLVVMCASLFPHVSALSLSQYLVSRYGAPPYTSATLSGPGGIVEMVPGVGACIRLAGLQLDSVAAPDWPLLAPIAATQNVAMLDLSDNNLVVIDLAQCAWCGGEDIQRIDLQDNRLTGAILGPGLAFGFVPANLVDTLVYLDLSRNPILSLPAGFGSATHWFTATGPEAPSFKCASCGLTGLTAVDLLQRTWATLDLSRNDFSNPALMSWPTSLGSASFVATVLLDLSLSGLTALPAGAINGGSNAGGGGGGGPAARTPTASSIIDLRYNNFTAPSSFSLAGLQFAGKVLLAQSGLRAIRGAQLSSSKLGALDLRYNNFGEDFDLKGVDWRESGSIDASYSNITHLGTGCLSGLSVAALDLSGSAFPAASSWGVKCFDGARMASLRLERCGLTGETLSSREDDSAGGGSGGEVFPAFHGLQGLVSLSMSNDGDVGGDTATWNRFDPLPNRWLLDSESLHTTLASITVGEVHSLPAGFFADVAFTSPTVASSGLAVVLQLPQGLAPLEQGGAVWNLLTGYSSHSLEDRLTYSLTLRGSNFTSVAPPALGAEDHPEGDRLLPAAISMPLDPAFLHSTFFQHFPSISKVSMVPPSAYGVGAEATPWSPDLTALPADLLAWAEGVVEFGIVLPLTTWPRSPVTTLDESFFSWLAPATGFGTLSSIDLSTAQLESYPQFLFSGLNRAGTLVSVDMQLLYAGLVPIPIGFFDDVPAVGPGGTALSGTSKLNKARNCPFIGESLEHYPNSVAQQCNICPAGSYTNAVSGYYYCARCPTGSYCTGSANKPCAPGTYQPFREQSSCLDCDAGTYNEAAGQAQAFACISCAAGRHNPAEGSASRSACVPCEAGSVSALPGAFDCSTCKAGTYSDEKRLSCIGCPTGRYSEEEGAASLGNCTRCPGGSTTASSGSVSPAQCLDITCGFGEWFDTARAAEPDWEWNETAGEELWIEHPNSYYCHECEPGFSCASNKKTACSPGYWSDGGLAECAPCPRGTYVPTSQASDESECVPCPSGTFNPDTGRSSCSSCKAGTSNPHLGSESEGDCVACAAGGVANASLCTSGAATAIALGALLPASSSFIAQSSAASARASYTPVRGGPSLRLTATPDDASLALAGAFDVPVGSSSSSHSDFDPTGDLIISDTMFILLLALLIGSTIPLLLYRVIPQKVVPKADVMSRAHKLEPGGVMVNRPTQWGAAFSMCFLLVAVYVAIQLGTASNATLVNTLQPASANNNTGTAQGAFQFSLKAYGSPAVGSGLPHALDSWCTQSGAAPTTGFTGGNATIRSVIQGEACVLLVDCLDCGMGGVGGVTLTVPYVAQLLEWEVWVTGAVPGSWSRFYGVVSQLRGKMLDAASTLRFSLIEAYFLDERLASSISYCTDPRSTASLSAYTGVTCSLPDASSGSGFELAFSEYSSEVAQASSQVTAASTVQLTFLFSKQDVVYQTTVSAKLSVFQILSSVLATVVSLLSVFMSVFAFSEQHLLRRLKWSSGPYDAPVHIVSEAERVVEEAARRKRLQKSAAIAAVAAGGGQPSSPRKITVQSAYETGADAGAGASSAAPLASPSQTGSAAWMRLDPDVQQMLHSHNGATAGAASSPSGSSAAALAQEVRELRAAQQAERAQTAALLAQMQAQLAALQPRGPPVHVSSLPARSLRRASDDNDDDDDAGVLPSPSGGFGGGDGGATAVSPYPAASLSPVPDSALAPLAGEAGELANGQGLFRRTSARAPSDAFDRDARQGQADEGVQLAELDAPRIGDDSNDSGLPGQVKSQQAL